MSPWIPSKRSPGLTLHKRVQNYLERPSTKNSTLDNFGCCICNLNAQVQPTYEDWGDFVGQLVDNSRFRVFFSGLVVILVVAEIGLRVVGFGHPIIYEATSAGYEARPSQTSTRLGKTTHINALGLRGPETTVTPATDVTRILSVGDSVANGTAAINDSQTYSAVLEKDLRQSGTKVEVLNASAGGWAPENELAWLREHGTFRAKVVILEINEKDLDQPFVDSSLLNKNPSFPARYPATALGELITRYLLPRLGIVKAEDPGSTNGESNPQAETQTLRTVADVNNLVKANGADLMLMYWDAKYPRVFPSTLVTREKLFQFALANKIRVVRPQINQRSDWQHFFSGRMHPNAAANILIAQQLAKALRASGDI